MNDAALIEIENTEVTTAHEVSTEAWLSKFAYTTTALTAISMWLESNGDSVGAQKVLEFAGEFAKHESETV